LSGLFCLTDKQRDQVDETVESRPNDSFKNQTQNHSLATSLDSADSDTYFCLKVEQENRKHILNNDSVEFITLAGNVIIRKVPGFKELPYPPVVRQYGYNLQLNSMRVLKFCTLLLF
jgi:hypothetical protein